MSGRDPRVTPRVGDVMRIDHRHVLRVRMLGPDRTVQIETAYSLPGEEDPCWVTGSEWRRWAAGAEVIRTGEGVER